ncbi:MAG: hypothetical protein ABL888_11310 [Pirellulaceae bacterium]
MKHDRVELWIAVAIVFIAAISFWVARSYEPFTAGLGRQRDDVYFENIAFHLARGEGVMLDFTNEEWRRPFDEANQAGENNWILAQRVRGITTSRSPGFPLLMAAVYQVAGRNWVAVRVVNVAILAVALTLLVRVVVRYFGWGIGGLALLTLLGDAFVLQTASQLMTESLATAVTCFLFVAVVELTAREESGGAETREHKRQRLWPWLGVGLLYGFGILVRANLNAWLALICVGLGAIVLGRLWRRIPLGPLLVPAVAFGLGVALIAAPWWIRNCVLTRAFGPSGTSGTFSLAGAYCDKAFSNGGNWDEETVLGSQQRSLQRPGFLSHSLPEQEFLMAEDSRQMARDWVAKNLEKLPVLALKRAQSHLGFYGHPEWLMFLNGLLIFGAVIGCIASRQSFGWWIAVVIGMSVLTTMLTWSHYGRYSIPIRPLIHVGSAIGTFAFWRFVLGLSPKR